MTELPNTARVVIIGGGVVGVSVLYHLAKAGWTDCVLLEKNELTAGSTWHAAGNIPTFSNSWAVMNLQRYSTELYRELKDNADDPIGYNISGSVRLAHSKERMQEFEHVASMARYQGLDIDIAGPGELDNYYPFAVNDDLEGILYDPVDGDIDPAQITQALARGARQFGARIFRFQPATGVKRDRDEWIVSTAEHEIRCEFVVNAGGYYAGRIGQWFGRQVPMTVMSHQYLLFDDIEEVKSWSQEKESKLPILRDVDTSYYLRQERYGFNLGPYERNCRAHWVDPSDPFPEDFSFELFPDDIERLEFYLEDAMTRVPLLQNSGLYKVINGPIPYTPDGNPLIGPMPGVPNAFEACVFTFGIAQAGGAGKVLSEWIIEGTTEWDMWSCDPRRFTDFCDADYSRDKAMEVYGHEYAMHFPYLRWPAGADRKQSPVHGKILELGGQMGVINGWERADWFAISGDDTSDEAKQTWSRFGPWEPRIRAECEAVRDNVGILDLPGFSRYSLEGPGAREFLLHQVAGNIPRPGRMGLSYFPDQRGRLLTEMSVLSHDEDAFTLITAAPAQWHDLDVLQNALSNPEIKLNDVTDDYSALIVTGPESRNLLRKLSDADLQKSWLSHQRAHFLDEEVMFVRASFAGELGWEIHAANSQIPKIYAALIEAGAKPFGMFALNCLRMEKGYRSWKGDLSTDYSLLEVGVDRFINFEKDQSFPGATALQKELQRGVRRAFATLIVDSPEFDAPYMSCVWKDNEIVGEVTSGAWGYRVEASLAFAMLNSEYLEADTKLEVEIYGKKYPASVQPQHATWDPENLRIRTNE